MSSAFELYDFLTLYYDKSSYPLRRSIAGKANGWFLMRIQSSPGVLRFSWYDGVYPSSPLCFSYRCLYDLSRKIELPMQSSAYL